VAAILGGLLGLVLAGGAIAYLGLNAERDLPGFIDDERVLKVAKRECRLMTRTVDGLAADGAPQDRLDVLRDQNTAVTTMVDRIRAVSSKVRDADRPVDDWLEDWELLVTDRAVYISEQRRGADTTFRVPRTPDGDPIDERMNVVAEDVCTVPDVLLKPELVGSSPI
jgi:hypothetical protein